MPFKSRLNQARNWLPGVFLVVAVVFAYQPAWHGGFIWDDNLYVTDNPLLTAPDGLKRIWFSTDSPSQYFPLTYTVFRLEHALWDLNTTGYHWINILLHAVNALLVWRLLKRLAVPGAWLAAAIFALHPVEVEAVAWITELKSVLSLFFMLLTLLCWIEFVEQPKRLWYAMALAFCALALFSKTTACTLPAALLLVLWLKHTPIHWQRLLQIAPFAAMAVGMGLLTMWWERYHIGTQGKMFSMTLPERIIVASHGTWFYLGKLFWPQNLTFSYPKWTIHPQNLSAYGWLGGVMGLGAAIYFTRRFFGRGVEAAMLFYMAMLSPLSGLVMLFTFRYTFVADHYQYVASIGIIALSAAGITIALKKKPFFEFIVCGALLLTLAVLTFRQCRMYANSETLWQTTLERNPDSFIGHNNLGYFLQQKGQWDEAIAQYKKGIEIQPDDWEACFNLGNVFAQKGDLAQAAVYYRRTLDIDPAYVPAYYCLGNTFLQKKQLDEAIAHYQKAERFPSAAIKIHSPEEIIFRSDLQNNFGEALFEKGSIDEAIIHFRKSVELNPDNAEAQVNLGKTLFKTGNGTDGLSHYRKAVELNPQSVAALNNIAFVLATSPDDSIRDGHAAVEFAQRANHLAGENPVTLGTLGAAYAEAGNFPEAIAAAQHASQLANTQHNAALAAILESQIKRYQAGLPLRDNSLTNQ